MINSILAKSIGAIIISYLVGSIPFSYVIGKANGVDIRFAGSNNPGASNVLRCCGKRAGILAYMLDIGKGMLAVFITYLLLGNSSLILVASGFTAILGHVFSVFLSFKGGKGVATSAGVMFVLAPVSILISLIFFFIGLFLSKKTVAIGSTSAAIAFPIVLTLINRFAPNLFQYFFGIDYIYLLIVSILVVIFIIFKHIPNYKRMIKGEEKSFSKK